MAAFRIGSKIAYTAAVDLLVGGDGKISMVIVFTFDLYCKSEESGI